MFGFQSKIDKKTRYIIVVGGVLLLVGLGYRLMPIWKSIEGGNGETALKEKQLAKYRQVVKEGDALREQLASLNQDLMRVESGLLKGRTPSLAAVEVQNVLNQIAGKNGVEVSSVRVLAAEKLEDSPYLMVPVQFTITPSIRQLKEMLYRIESSAKYLTVQEARINVVRRRKGEEMQAVITVAGLMKKAQKVEETPAGNGQVQ